MDILLTQQPMDPLSNELPSLLLESRHYFCVDVFDPSESAALLAFS
jgi:hypothetical protein